MFQAENIYEYSQAEALAIDALFRRIAERGHRIRLQKRAINSDSGEEPNDGKDLSLQTVVTGENGQAV